MRSCVFCKVRYQKGSPITFHKFPSDSKHSKLWQQNMNLDKFTPKMRDFLCSNHFNKDCFIRHASRTALKKYSVPTLFHAEKSSPHTEVTPKIKDITGNTIEIKKEPCEAFHDHDAEIFAINQEVALKIEITTTKIEVKEEPCGSFFDHDAEESSSEQSVNTPEVEDAFELTSTIDIKEEPCGTLYDASVFSSHQDATIDETEDIFETTKANASVNYDDDFKTTKIPRTILEISVSVNHDHSYHSTPESSKRTLNRVQNALEMSRAQVELWSQRVKRLKSSVTSLETFILDYNKEK